MRGKIGVNIPLSEKRLSKDYLELKECEIPLVGVAAAPEENNMKVWHANLKGPEGTPYKGGVFHLTI
jgi:ubiquitin-protein ligase